MEKKEREKSTEKIEILSEDSAREMMMVVFDYINKIATSVAWSTRVKFLRRDGLVLFFYLVTRQLPTSSRHTQKNIHRRLCYDRGCWWWWKTKAIWDLDKPFLRRRSSMPPRWYQNQFSLFSIIRHRVEINSSSENIKDFTMKLNPAAVEAVFQRRAHQRRIFFASCCSWLNCVVNDLARFSRQRKASKNRCRSTSALLRVDDRFVASSCAQPQTTISERF